MDEVR